MEINATIAVQFLHFCFIYWLLHTFFFKETLRRLVGRREKNRTLQTAITEKKQALLVEQKRIHKTLEAFQEDFIKQHPTNLLKFPEFPAEGALSCSKTTLNNLVDDAATFLIKRVPHVD